MAKPFDICYKTLRHALIRLWERRVATVDTVNGPSCDFWLVCHSKDWQTAILTIESIRRYSLNPVGAIFLVGNELNRPAWLPGGVSYVFEGELPATAAALDVLKGVRYKGWVLQQVLKYSAIEYSERFVIIDCDTVLLKPHLFFTDGGTVLRFAYEYSPHYRQFEKCLSVNGGVFFSFTCHMMPYKAERLGALISRIEEISGQNWVTYICNYAKQNGMVVNEQDLYARYILETNEKILFRPWLNKTVVFSEIDVIENLRLTFADRNSVSFHNNDARELVISAIAK